MKLPLLSLTAEPSTIAVKTEIFGAPINLDLIAQAIHVYRSNQRQGGAKVKRRGEVRMTTHKWYRQKGTGRARHGAQSAPLFVGGGVAHGPTGQENWKRSLTPVQARQALIAALSAQTVEKKVSVVADLDQLTGKTKPAAAFLKAVCQPENQKVLIVIDKSHDNLLRALRNIESVQLTSASRLNAWHALSAQKVLIMQPALDILAKRLENK